MQIAVAGTVPSRRILRTTIAIVRVSYANLRDLFRLGMSSPPDIVRTETTEERILVAVAEGTGITLLVEERAITLRYPGVTFRRFAEPEPTVALGVAFRQPPSLAARRFVDLAQELGRQPQAGRASTPVAHA